ncbi:hypothetical protein LY01_02410 [Nonlabens xylanidelens]|uniref:Uncharacterized protein n=1 Tax=Nonlabens xylanidelens TaxID=191564 RepID=A0A2S6IHE4_9FLAO|nr:hypothetical protein [Nonlabens xylanidelens]PPK93627.1 hypothetical protein LY01_02410 [Nonlabens xylanidelens]
MIRSEMFLEENLIGGYEAWRPHVRAANNLPNNPRSGCSTSACELRQEMQKTHK